MFLTLCLSSPPLFTDSETVPPACLSQSHGPIGANYAAGGGNRHDGHISCAARRLNQPVFRDTRSGPSFNLPCRKTNETRSPVASLPENGKTRASHVETWLSPRGGGYIGQSLLLTRAIAESTIVTASPDRLWCHLYRLLSNVDSCSNQT